MKNVLEIVLANIRTHLSDETLSDLVSGELAGGKLRRAQFHLSKCWKCRSRYEQLERAAMGFVELHKQIITPNPPEVSQWREMFLARLDKRLSHHVAHTLGAYAEHHSDFPVSKSFRAQMKALPLLRKDFGTGKSLRCSA